jgi:hypothetical protein
MLTKEMIHLAQTAAEAAEAHEFSNTAIAFRQIADLLMQEAEDEALDERRRNSEMSVIDKFGAYE